LVHAASSLSFSSLGLEHKTSHHGPLPHQSKPSRHSKPRAVPHCEAQQTSSHAPLSGTPNVAVCPNVRHKSRPTPHCLEQQISPCAPLSGTANLALCPTVRHKNLALFPSDRHSKPHPVPHCPVQQTSYHAPMSDTANLALCPSDMHVASCHTVRHSKPRSTPHSQTLQTSHHASLSGTATEPCAPLSGRANHAPCPTLRHFKPRTTPHCQTQQTSPCAALSVMMPEFIRRMQYSGTTWQVCHALHYLVFLMQFVLQRAAAFVSSPIHLFVVNSVIGYLILSHMVTCFTLPQCVYKAKTLPTLASS